MVQIERLFISHPNLTKLDNGQINLDFSPSISARSGAPLFDHSFVSCPLALYVLTNQMLGNGQRPRVPALVLPQSTVQFLSVTTSKADDLGGK